MNITDETNQKLAEVFAVAEDTPEEKRAKERRSIRFNPDNQEIYFHVEGKRQYTRINPDYTFLRYVERPDRTPTGGRYMRRQLTVRHRDGTLWVGNVKRDTSVVRLRRIPDHRVTP